MATATQQHTTDVLAEVMSGATHVDAFDILMQDVQFLENMVEEFGRNPSKEEQVVLGKYKTILDNKVEYLDQALKFAGLTAGSGKGQYKDWNLLYELYNITILVSTKEEA
jgi:hypothetical protein